MELGERSLDSFFWHLALRLRSTRHFGNSFAGRANYPFLQAVLDKSDSLSSESSMREMQANAVCGLRGRQGLTGEADSLQQTP